MRNNSAGRSEQAPADGGDEFGPASPVQSVDRALTILQMLAESGELVETRGLVAPVHTRRVQLAGGVPVVTDGPYAETEEVLAGYWLVDCDSFDRATEIAARLANCPGPDHIRERAFVDVRPVAGSRADLEP